MTLPASFIARLAPLALASSILAAGSAGAAEVKRLVRDIEPRLIEWRRDIHQHPELSNREVRTAKKVETHLRALGLDVKTGIAHTGVTALLKGGKPGPTIALRADMDALPVTEEVDLPYKSTATGEFRGEKVGVMHACGHDGHVAILMGAAQVLTTMRSELPGTILFIFQPAEEGVPEGETGGAKQMLAEGIFATVKPEAVFSLHLWSTLHAGQIGYRSGALMAASDRFRVVVSGKQTHGARPWLGIDPIVIASQIVTAMQTVVSRQVNITENPAVVTVGTIKGGIRFNIIPDQVEMTGTIRTFSKEQRASIVQSLERLVTDTAAASGATATFTLGQDPNPVTYNDPALTARLLPTLQRVAGKDNVVVVPPDPVAEDFAHMSTRVPGLYFIVGVTPPDRDLRTTPTNHSPRFYVDESALPLGLRAIVQVAIDYLNGAPRG